uniref:Ig-like domain-containing protein n=1 Tax=Zosterops lateralis melanops TaxID=1220523 RepID=A0A8D2QNQ1_ZOSLA
GGRTPLAISCTPTPHSLLLSLLNAGVVIGPYIEQWPGRILQRAGDSLNISCYQNYSNLAYMFWYQQPPGNGLKLIVATSTWTQNFYEDGYSEAKFEVNRKRRGYILMTIKNVTAKDEATYFCAANDHTV